MKQSPADVYNKSPPPQPSPPMTTRASPHHSYLQLQETLRVQFTACTTLIIPSPGQEGESDGLG